jgi:transcriptional regulator with XRE-family HTH domain
MTLFHIDAMVDATLMCGTYKPMPRRAKDPNHPLERLRRQLSTPNFYMTRAHLAQRAGVAEVTLRDIELKKFKLTSDVAIKIGIATEADPASLISGDDPIRDFVGNPLTPDSPKGAKPPKDIVEGLRQLFEAALETAMEKNIGFLIVHSFNAWLSETCRTYRTYGLDSLLAEKLTERLGSFDPEGIPVTFRPKNPKLAAEWKRVEQEIEEEFGRTCQEELEDARRQGYVWDEQRTATLMRWARTDLRFKAIEKLRQRRANAQKQQSRSPVRKAARSTRT